MEIFEDNRSECRRLPSGVALGRERMRKSFSTRLACSFKALGIMWFVSGIMFCLIVKGPSTVSFWCIWGSAFFVLGWLFVGLPIVALGERILRASFLLLIFAGGLGGSVVMALPAIFFGHSLPPGAHWAHSFNDLKWEGIAFVAAALTTGLYYRFLRHEAVD
ncbi:MAG TPA: hypothetical protein VFL79_20670 [Terriglobia bacterium]|nr:hypothetical protein [Terriglobia bacterium]